MGPTREFVISFSSQRLPDRGCRTNVCVCVCVFYTLHVTQRAAWECQLQASNNKKHGELSKELKFFTFLVFFSSSLQDSLLLLRRSSSPLS